MRKVLGRMAVIVVGVFVGALAALGELMFTLVTGLCLGPVLGSQRGQRAVLERARAVAVVLTRWERARLARFADGQDRPDGLDPSDTASYDADGALRYIAARWPVGLLGGLVLGTLLIGTVYASVMLWVWFVTEPDSPFTVVTSSLAGLLLAFLSFHGLYGVAAMDSRLARHHLGPSEQVLMRRRIDELATTRAGVLAAVHDERRRIERYLHDGMQQQVVALGMLLGRAQRSEDPARSAELVRQAHEEARRTLDELRDVAWRVYPAVLDEAGLHAALETVAERSGLPVRLRVSLAREPAEAVRTVAYFVVSEAVTNAAKHAAASHAEVRLSQHDGALRVRVEDDGHGGADPAGGGLLGLARRVAALDGELRVSSPAGGPTVLTAVLPCD